MASKMAILTRTQTLIKTLNHVKSISTFPFISQQAQLSAEPLHADPNPVPPPAYPASGSPRYYENWRNPALADSSSIVPFNQAPSPLIQNMSQRMDLNDLLNTFANWMTTQRWSDIKQLFEFWIRSLDRNGKPNRPDVNVYNHYLRANFMLRATVADLVDLVAQMEGYNVLPNTASFNLVLRAMHQARETAAAEKLFQRMELSNESAPDDDSYELITGMLFLKGDIDTALKYIDKALKNGYMLSTRVFNDCVRVCSDRGRLDALTLIIEKCKTSDQNKALCPTWYLCNFIAEVAVHADNSKLAYYALEFMAKWLVRGERASPPILLSVDEGLIVATLGTAGRAYNSTLVDACWAVLCRSLRGKGPNPESFIAKICAYASLGNLLRAFSTLREFETTYANADKEVQEELFSPFTSLHPLVVACSKNGFETLDSVYFQLENLSRAAEHPYKSIAAVNCVILGCASIWDLDRAYQTFEAIGQLGLSPNIHSFNALMYAFGKLKQTDEAGNVLKHMISTGIKPNAMSYSLLVDAHLVNRDAKSALNVIDDMVSAGFSPSKETLKKIKRRCIREMDYDSRDRVDAIANKFQIRMAGGENRRNMLFDIDYSMPSMSMDYP